ncbi:MAG: class I SAM-dependent methyltransferase [Candidatus Bathyarchaeia archaeon]
MRDKILQKYNSKEHPHFIDVFDVPMVENLIKTFNKPFSLIDLGCGDGRFIYNLRNKGLLNNARKIVGVDLSEERIERFKRFNPFAQGVVSDVCDLQKIENDSFDLAISSQVIEHVPNDEKMLKGSLQNTKTSGFLLRFYSDKEAIWGLGLLE